MKRKKNGIVFISWQDYCSRSDSIARKIGGKSFMIYSPFWGSHYLTIIFKYFSQFIKTLLVLWGERPKLIFVMTPPVVACIPVWLYSEICDTSYVIDAHTGAFIDERWKRVMFLHKYFSRKALTTIVTNPHFKKMIQEWNADSMIVTDVPVHFAKPEKFVMNGSYSYRITLASSFAYDEPIAEFLEAARKLSDIQFYVTGNYKKIGSKILKTKPDNVIFTGFLSDSKYAGLLNTSDAVIALTRFDNTMQRGAYEAIYLGKPVITSNFEILRNVFYKGTVYVDCSPEEIICGIQKMVNHLKKYKKEAEELRTEKLKQWLTVENELRKLINPKLGISKL